MDDLKNMLILIIIFIVSIIPLTSKNDNSNLEKAEKIYSHLKNNNIDVLLDDTDENISAKLKKFDLIGIPYQIILGKKSDADLIEFKEINNSSKNHSIDEIKKILTINKNSN